MTKLAYYSDKVIEWCWLAALVFTPLFFNVYSSRVFEPDKLSVLRTIALIAGVAWAIKILEGVAMRGTAAAIARSGGTATASTSRPASHWWQIPLLLPILIYAALYLFSTITSVTPFASIFGSYQRLQGLISQYAYILLALTIIFNLRRREQLERIITFAIATSVPVALYGFIQHQGLDPLPWAGDVTDRVASSMGNAIFVAAWLIMVVPLMLYRIANLLDGLFSPTRSDIERETRDGEAFVALGFFVLCAFQNLVLWTTLNIIANIREPNPGLWLILPTAILIFYLLNFAYSLARKGSRWLAYAQLTGLALLLLFTLVIIVFTQSRGPLLGLGAGIVVFVLVALWMKRMRLLFGISAALVALFLGFLVVFNLPDSPIAGLRDVKYIGRLGEIFQTQDGTGRVRLLIWQGSLNLITADPVRMFIGYGPESMYVAYNKYYPADLQHWELRNATPDRSHNAYLDQAVTMGLLGEAAWLFLIGSFFFFVWRALRRTKSFASQALILGLASGVLAHLVEILVGIQIAVTYLYFYTYLASFVALSFFIERTLQPQLATKDEADSSTSGGPRVTMLDRPKEQEKAKAKEEVGVMRRLSLALSPRPLALVSATNIGTLTMAFANSNNSNNNNSSSANASSGNRSGSNQPRKGSGNRNKNNQPPARPTPPQRPPTPADTNTSNGSNGATVNGSTVGTPVTPTSPPRPPQSQLQRTTPSTSARQRVASGRVDQARMRPLQRWFANTTYLAVYAGIIIAALMFIFLVNYSLVAADVLYKQGQSADQQQVWPQSVQNYQQAINLQPDQDYYYLFLGRAYMEWAKNPSRFQQQQLTAEQAQQATAKLIAESEKTLLRAKQLNPMNTDHYANLGRLYIYWGGSLGQSQDAATKQDGLTKLRTGVDYYKQAVALSPQNAQIWNEYALAQRSLALYLNQVNPPTLATSTNPTSTNTVSSSGTISATATTTGTTDIDDTAGSTDDTQSALNLPMPKRGDSLNPEAKAILEQAEQTINHTIDNVDNKFANSYYIKAEIERSLSDAPQAAAAYIKMITLVPVGNDTPSLAALADNEITTRSEFIVAGRVYTDVINALKLVTTKPATPDPNRPELGLYADSKEAHNVLGFLYWKSGQLDAAINELKKVTTADNSDYFAHRNLGVLFGLNKNYQEQLNELAIGRDILNTPSIWQKYFSSQQEHDNELASVQATIQQVEQQSGLKAPAPKAGTTPQQPPTQP